MTGFYKTLTGRLKSRIKEAVLGTTTLRRLSVAYCSKHGHLPEIFVRTPANQLRNLLMLPHSPHNAQLNQDIFALLANQFRRGYFLEIGANDGVTLSNTLYLEEQFGWDGLLVEANPQYRESLSRRQATSVIAAVVDSEGYYEFCSAGLYGGIKSQLDKTHESRTKTAGSIMVWGTTLERLLADNNVPTLIDFISIDVEGAELRIVEQMCKLPDRRFACGCIEHNGRLDDYREMVDLLQCAGYRIVWGGQTQQDLFFVDNRDFSRND